MYMLQQQEQIWQQEQERVAKIEEEEAKNDASASSILAGRKQVDFKTLEFSAHWCARAVSLALDTQPHIMCSVALASGTLYVLADKRKRCAVIILTSVSSFEPCDLQHYKSIRRTKAVSELSLVKSKGWERCDRPISATTTLENSRIRGSHIRAAGMRSTCSPVIHHSPRACTITVK
eukprot:scaffold4973_cov111-Skeletonema_marinoi.AAC.5